MSYKCENKIISVTSVFVYFSSRPQASATSPTPRHEVEAQDSMWTNLSCHVSLRAVCRWHVCFQREGALYHLNIPSVIRTNHRVTSSCLTLTRNKSSNRSNHKLYDIIHKMPKKVGIYEEPEHKLWVVLIKAWRTQTDTIFLG